MNEAQANLKGVRIAVTRPEGQVEDLCHMIESQGGQVIRFPLLIIRPLAPDTTQSATFSDLSRFDYLIFISRNSVEYAVPLFKDQLPQLKATKVFAIGAATAAALAQHGVKDLNYCSEQASSEALLDMQELQVANIHNKGVLIVRGRGGREVLQETLTARGAMVEALEVYERLCPDQHPTLIQRLWTGKGPDIIIVTSNEALMNLIKLTPTDRIKQLYDKQLVVMSERIADAALAKGFTRQPLIAKSTDDEGLLLACIEVVNEERA